MSVGHSPTLRALALATAAVALAGCSSIDSALQGDKVDYRASGTRTSGLEVPPDLTQLARDPRYQPSGGVVSAAALQAGGPTPLVGVSAGNPVAPVATADLRIDRAGDKRWLVTSVKPEQLWPQLQGFWKERGFELVLDQPETGIMETDWAENRAKIPNDGIRSLLGRVLDSFYSSGERDRFRTRLERTPNGTEVFITHRGMVEVYTSALQDQTVWQPRPADPELEAEFLTRLMQKLGKPEEAARTEVATAPAAPARARLVADQPAATLQVDDGFERAWRRVGVSLDRSGFTVEDRDRAQGLYFVRYVDPKDAARAEPGFFARMFSGGGDGQASLSRFRIAVKGQGDAATTVSVQNAQGAPENSSAAQRVVALLVDDLK